MRDGGSLPFREVSLHFAKEKFQCADIISTNMLLKKTEF